MVTGSELSPVVAIAGPPGVGKRCLIQRVFELDVQQADPGSVQRHSMVTKYYTADVDVVVCRSPEDALPYLPRLEAVVLVGCADQSHSLSGLAEDYREVWQAASVRLCIGSKADLCPEGIDARVVGASEWCPQSGFEYVEVAAAVREVDEGLCCGEDGHGCRRVVEALQAHMWPGLVLTQPAGGPGAEQGVGVAVGEADSESDSDDGDSPADAADGCHGDEGEGELNEMEAIMQEMRRVREVGSQLPDDQRRAMAGDMAMRMMSAMGLE